jgi:hypothetical protein
MVPLPPIFKQFEFKWLLFNVLIFSLEIAFFGVFFLGLTSFFNSMRGDFQSHVIVFRSNILETLSYYNISDAELKKTIINLARQTRESGFGLILNLIFITIFSIPIGTMQYILLKGEIRLPKWWVLLNSCSMILGWIFLSYFNLSFLLRWGGLATIQWLGLRKKVSYSSYWALANSFTFIFTFSSFLFIPYSFIGYNLGETGADGIDLIILPTIFGLIFGCIIGAINGMITLIAINQMKKK